MPNAQIFNNGDIIKPFPEEGFTPVHLQQWLDGKWMEGSAVRRTIEVSVPRQCIAAGCGPPPIAGEAGEPNRCCYICGFPITESGGSDAAASQCEHVLTVLVIAMICGLSHPDYQKIVRGWVDAAAGGEPTATQSAFQHYREKLLREGTGEAANCGGGNYGTFYKWAHPSCNLIKNNFPYLPITFGPGGPIIDEGWNTPAATNEFKMKSIKYTLYKLISYTEQNSIKWVNYWGQSQDPAVVASRTKANVPQHPLLDVATQPPTHAELVQWKQWADGRSLVVLDQYIQPIATILDRYTLKERKRYSAIAMNMTFKYFEEKLNRKRQQAQPLTIDLELRDYYAKMWNTLKKEDRNELGGLLLKANVRPRRISIPAKINKTIKKSKQVIRLLLGNPMQFGGGQIGGAGQMRLEVEEKKDPLSVYHKNCQQFYQERVRVYSGDLGAAKLKLMKVLEILPIISYMVNAITMLDGDDELQRSMGVPLDDLEDLIGDEAHIYVELYKKLLIEYCGFESEQLAPHAGAAAEEEEALIDRDTWTGDHEYGLDLFLDGLGSEYQILSGGLGELEVQLTNDLGPLDLLWTVPRRGEEEDREEEDREEEDREQKNFYIQMIKVLNSFKPLKQLTNGELEEKVWNLYDEFTKPIYGADVEEILYGRAYTYDEVGARRWISLDNDYNWDVRTTQDWESLANSDNVYPMYKEFTHFKPNKKRMYRYIFIMGEVNEVNTHHPFQITMSYSQWIAFFSTCILSHAQ